MNNQDEQRTSLIIADNLDSLLSGSTTLDVVMQRCPDLAEEIRCEYETALWLLDRRAQVEPAPEFLNRSKKRMLNRIQTVTTVEKIAHSAQTAGAGKTNPRPYRQPSSRVTRQRAYRFAVALALILVLALSFTGTAYASQGTLPGETLYPVKLWTEDARLALASTPAEQASLRVEFSERRLDEVQLLFESGQGPLSISVLDRYDQQVSEVADFVEQNANGNLSEHAVFAQKMKSALEKQNAKLEALQSKSAPLPPGKLKEAITQAQKVSNQAQSDIQAMGTEPKHTPQEGSDEPSAAHTPVPSDSHTPQAKPTDKPARQETKQPAAVSTQKAGKEDNSPAKADPAGTSVGPKKEQNPQKAITPTPRDTPAGKQGGDSNPPQIGRAHV